MGRLDKLDIGIDEALGQGRIATVVEHPAKSAKYDGRRRDSRAAEIELSRIVAKKQHRKEFNSAEIKSLADDISARGLLQAIVVRWSHASGKYEIIAGERRYRAVKLLGHTAIRTYEVDEKTAEPDIAEMQLAENFKRKNLNPIELAQAFQDVMNKRQCTARDLAKRLGVHETTVTRQLRYLKLPVDIQQMIVAGKLSKTAAREIARLDNEGQQRRLAQSDLTSNEVANEAAKVKQGKTRKARSRKKPPTELTFYTDFGQLVIRPSKTKEALSYHHLEAIAEQALEKKSDFA